MTEIRTQVLIVEDDSAFADLMIFWLEQKNCICSYAANGVEALELVRKKYFDLIVTDLNMPQLDGFELIKELRELGEYKHTPIIVISSENREESLIKILNGGADDFLPKPLTEEIFLSKVMVNLKKANLKKSIYKKNQTRNINFDEGEILYCMSKEGLSPNLLPDDLRVRSVFSKTDFFQLIEDNTIWVILIDQDANWAINIFDKISDSIDGEIPVILLVNSSMKQFIDFDVDNYIFRDISEEYILDQLRFLVERERKLKNKYVNALHVATENTAFSFDRITRKEYKDFRISIIHEPYANMPGGDFYEVFSYDERHKIVFFGDIMGKAWGAWFFVPAYIAYIRSTIKFMSYRNIKKTIESPGRILEILNRYLAQDMRFSDVFTTLSIAVIDLEANTVRIAGAGAISPLHYKRSENIVETINVPGILMGLDEDTKYSKVDIPFETGDRLLFYTDGYSEASDSELDTMIGNNGIEKVFSVFAMGNSVAALDLDGDIINKCNIESFMDDRSLLLISRV